MAKKNTKPKQAIIEHTEVITPFRFKAKNEEQQRAWEQIAANDFCFLSGIAGSGKTTIAVAYAVQNHKQYEKIVIARPAVESCEKLGFVPGSLESKLSPYLRPVFDAIDKTTKTTTSFREMINAKVEMMPLAYTRGMTFENCFCILDEAQNATAKAIEMFMTRLGEGSKMVLCGDDGQPDIHNCVLGQVAKAFYEEGQAGWCALKKSVRHPRILSVVRIMEPFVREEK